MTESSPHPQNRLARERSPYLLQHARNPVDWFPWGDEAFEKARREDKPIFLSVGYSTCHWCHVMEKESFEDAAVARFLNDNFVSVKVDREERPDVDKTYMAYVQAVTGSGGWPMSVWLTPELEPFYGGTYFPPSGKFGRPGFLDLLRGLAGAWKTRRQELAASASATVAALRAQAVSTPPAGDPLTEELLRNATAWFVRNFDERHGGFGGAPKFPRPSLLLFLLRWAKRSGDATFAEMATATLRAMARGGIHDALGGGFHRYSVDERWHVPHFEKMLYDQGQLAVAYAEGYQWTGDPHFERTLRGICDYVLRDLTSPDGAFYCAEDADSLPDGAGPDGQKREGAFYVFTAEEVRRAAGDAAPALVLHFGIEEGGNAKDPHGELTGQNVLYTALEPAEVAARLGVAEREARALLVRGKEALLRLRSTRPRPHLDDKILTGWNGLMIAGLAKAAFVLGEARYAEAAARAAEFLWTTLRDPSTGEVLRRHRQGDSALRGQCEDYAFYAWGLLELYTATGDTAHLSRAALLQREMEKRFADPVGGGWFGAPEGDPTVLLRFVEDYDGAEPAPSSVAVWNAVRLSEWIGDPELRARAERALAGFASRLRTIPAALPHMLVALDAWLSIPEHVVIAGDRDDPLTRELASVVARRFLPNTLLVRLDRAGVPFFREHLPWTAALTARDGRPAAYACTGGACRLPVQSGAELAAQLDSPAPAPPR